jgi:ribosomal protein S18 acetylase RimI-like enzyme
LNLSVATARQRQGHGSALLTEVMRLARSRDARQLFLEVRPTNAGAKALYSRFGFAQVAVRPAYYPAHGRREDALVLTRTL